MIIDENYDITWMFAWICCRLEFERFVKVFSKVSHLGLIIPHCHWKKSCWPGCIRSGFLKAFAHILSPKLIIHICVYIKCWNTEILKISGTVCRALFLQWIQAFLTAAPLSCKLSEVYNSTDFLIYFLFIANLSRHQQIWIWSVRFGSITSLSRQNPH